MNRVKRAALLLCLLLTLTAVGCGERSAAAIVPETPEPTEAAETATPQPSPVPTPSPSPTPSPTPTPEPTPCPHTVRMDGVCTACGDVCPHPDWENGRCPVCGSYCSHPFHDGGSLLCLTCGLYVPHNFLRSECDMCGAVPEFISGVTPRNLFAMIDRRGLVETLSYQTIDYAAQSQGLNPAPYTKALQVYTPYGYNPSEKYDVLILLHGMGGTETYWLSDPQQYKASVKEMVYTSRLLDNLMDMGYCRKMIVVAPCFYRDGANQADYQRPADEDQFVQELREDILPLIIDRYSTYARSSDPADITAARRHFAYAGLSMGSIYAYTSIMPKCLDYFSWFGCFSGSGGDIVESAAGINSEANADYPIYYFYNSISTRDDMYAEHLTNYNYLIFAAGSLTDGENAVFTDVSGGGHIYQAWCTGLYNFLRVVFAQPLEH